MCQVKFKIVNQSNLHLSQINLTGWLKIFRKLSTNSNIHVTHDERITHPWESHVKRIACADWSSDVLGFS